MTKLPLFFLSAIVLLSACSHASQEKAMMVEGNKISLDNDNCLLSIGSKTLNLEMKPRCYFVSGDSGKDVGIEYYADIDAHVLLVVGTSAPKNPDYPLTLKRDDCGEQLQAVVITKTSSVLSRVSSNTLICAGIGADEKIYYMLSHQ